MNGNINIWDEANENTKKILITNEDPETRNVRTFTEFRYIEDSNHPRRDKNGQFKYRIEKVKKLIPPECVVINFYGHPELEIENLKGMPKNLPNLEIFEIRRIKLKTLKGIPKNLPNLKFLSAGCSKLENLSELPRNLRNLKTLGISCPKSKNLSGMPQNLPNLTRLSVGGESFESLKGIPPDFTSLQELRISNAPLETLQYLPNSLPKLEKIYISHTSLRNLEYFPTNTPCLKEIILVRNKLVLLKGLPPKIPVLEKLDLSYNQLTSLEDIPFEFDDIPYQSHNKFRRPYLNIRVHENPVRTLAGIKYRPLFKMLVGFRESSYRPDIIGFQLCPTGLKLINDYHEKKIEKYEMTLKYLEREEFNTGLINSLSHLYDDVEMPTAEDLRRFEREIPALKTAIIEFYRKTPMELAQQYVENPESLTEGELERLSWEGGYQERQLLESNLSLDNDNPNSVLEDISKRLCHQLSSGLSILK